MKNKVAIIGAGPMGLACAYYLGSEYDIVVYEQGDRPGGMTASFDFDGFPIEKFYHFINVPDEHLFQLLQDLEIYDALKWTPTKMGFFSPDENGTGRLQPWGNPVALLQFKGIDLLTRLRYGFHAYTCKFRKSLDPLDDISAADWIRRWEGRKGYDFFWRFLFEKKFFQLADPLSAAWIASRVRRVAKSRSSMMEERLGYLDGGSQLLIDTLMKELKRRNVDVRLATPVKQVSTDAERGGGTVLSSSGEERFDFIISTAPLPYVDGLFKGLPESYRAKVRQMRNVAVACVLFRLEKPLTENFWLNVNMPQWDIPGVIEYSNLRPTEHAYVYVPYYMPQDHPNWKMDDAGLLDNARACLRMINSDAMATEQAARVFRYEYAQPVCPPGFRHILPPYWTGIKGVFAADTAHSFPEDRSIHESTRIAKEIVELLRKST